jgi:hypothetical protein
VGHDLGFKVSPRYRKFSRESPTGPREPST